MYANASLAERILVHSRTAKDQGHIEDFFECGNIFEKQAMRTEQITHLLESVF